MIGKFTFYDTTLIKINKQGKSSPIFILDGKECLHCFYYSRPPIVLRNYSVLLITAIYREIT